MIEDHSLCDLVVYGYENHTDKKHEVEYLVVEHEEFTVVVFRGTEANKLVSGGGWVDVVRDLRIVPWYNKNTGWVHAGFLKGAMGVLKNGLKFRVSKTKPLVLTGHSLGAIMSLLAAQILSKEGYSICKWVGFGCPRGFIGDRTFAFPTVSYRNGIDIVTEIPRTWMFGYKQLPLTSIGQPGTSFGDHDIKLYRANLSGE